MSVGAPESWYKVDSRRITVAEYRNMGSGLGLAIALVAKFLRIRLPLSLGLPSADAIEVVDRTALGSRDLFVRKLEEGEACGLRLEICQLCRSLGQDAACGAVLLDGSDEFVAQVVHARSATAGVVTETCAFSCLTRLAGGTFIATSDQKPQMKVPPRYRTEHVVGRPVAEVLERHRQRLRGLGAHDRIVRVRPEGVQDFILEVNRAGIEFQLARGVYLRMTDGEVESLRARRLRTAGSPGYAAVERR